MKKVLASVAALVVVFFSTSTTKATISETSVWDSYTLFNTPIVVDKSPSLQSLYITDIGDNGWSFMSWSAFDLNGSDGNEIDLNIRKKWSVGNFSIMAAVGYWNINDIETINGDIGIESLTITHKGFNPFGVSIVPSVMVRYHHDVGSHRFGEGFATVAKLDVSKTIERLKLSVSPFFCYDTFNDFGATTGFSADVAIKLTERMSVFAAARYIKDLDGDDASTFGIGLRSVF